MIHNTIALFPLKKIACCLTLLLSAQAYAQSPVTANASLESVTVFSSGVEMNHKAKIAVPAGSSEIVINNVANVLDESSIRIGGGANVTIMSVSFTRNYLKAENKTPAYLKVDDSLKAARSVLRKLDADYQAEANTLQLLEKNQSIGGANTGVNVAELEKMVAFNKAKYAELSRNMIAFSERQAEQQKVVARLEKQLAEESKDQSATGGQLVLQVMANTATTSDFNITYQSPNAGWTAFYDLRAENTSSNLKILYKANLVQNTGLDWKKVKLTLSTGNPTQSNTAPLLNAWFLRYGVPAYASQNNYYQNRMQSMSVEKALDGAAPGLQVTNGGGQPGASEEMRIRGMRSKSLSDYTEQQENQLSATFDVELPYDIASNDKPHSVSLKEYSLPVNYKYYAVPKADPDAFLMAEVSQYEKLNLVPGDANIILENMYVGKSFLNPYATTDTLNLSMGRDKKITIKREKVMEQSGVKLLGSNKKQTFTYEIRVRNGKREAVSLLLKDQYPVATDNNMEIELLEATHAEVNKETGVLTWKLNIAPGATEKVRISYSVKYPKDKIISNL